MKIDGVIGDTVSKIFRALIFTGEGKMLLRGRKAQLVPCFGGVEIMMCFWIACAILTLVASQQKFYIQGRYGKRQEPRTGESSDYLV